MVAGNGNGLMVAGNGNGLMVAGNGNWFSLQQSAGHAGL
jgi:hypothetical protein